MTDPVLSVKQLSCRLQNRSILHDVSFELYPNEIVTIVGPNGAGKSTLIRLLLGLLPAQSGQITYAPDLVIGYMPQKCHIDPHFPLTVKRFFRLGMTQPKAEDIERSLAEVGMLECIDNQISTLSGGEWQRVLLARSLLRHPQLLVLDEPTQGVDLSGIDHFYQLIAQIRDSRGCSVLMVSHDLNIVMANTNRVICLNQHICCQGRPDLVSQDEQFIQLFGQRSAKELALYTHHHNHQHDVHGEVIPIPKTGESK